MPIMDSVSNAKWTWKALGKAPAPKKPMSRQVKATIQAVIMSIVGSVLFAYFHHHIAAYIVWFLAALVLVGGLFVPAIFHGFEKFGMLLGKWVGTGLTYMLLVPFFYICFLPGRIIQIITGNDPMTRKFPTKEPSYWIPRKPVRSIDQYRKQH